MRLMPPVVRCLPLSTSPLSVTLGSAVDQLQHGVQLAVLQRHARLRRNCS